MNIWTRGGRLIINASGQPILCDECPCVGELVETGCTLEPLGAVLVATIYRLEADLETPYGPPYSIEIQVVFDDDFVFTTSGGGSATGAWLGSGECEGKVIDIQIACAFFLFSGWLLAFKILVDGEVYFDAPFITVEEAPLYADTIFDPNHPTIWPCETQAPSHKIVATEAP